jgi:hypothetical protein
MPAVFQLLVDFSSLSLILFLCFVIGLLAIELLPKESLILPQLAAPILGFGWICILTTIFYRFGASPLASFSVLLLVATIVLALRSSMLMSGIKAGVNSRARVIAFLGVLMAAQFFALLPSTIGGPQFSVFQGNPHDQLNYLGLAVSVVRYSYTFLSQLPEQSRSLNNFIAISSSLLHGRPSAGIAYAVFGPLLFGYMYEKTHVFIAFLQVLTFFSMTFLLVNLLARGLIAAAIVGLAFAAGGFVQYVIDINAWSHLAGLSVALIAVTMSTSLALAPLFASLSSDDIMSQRLYGRGKMLPAAASLAAAIAPLVYVYPEMLVPYGAATGTALLVVALLFGDQRQTGRTLLMLAMAGALCLIVAAGYWQGTLGDLAAKAQFALVAIDLTHKWSLYFQRYIFDASISEGGYVGVYALFSWPVDFLYGTLGLYFMRPPAELSLAIRIIWKLVLYVPLVGLAMGVYRVGRASLRRATPPFIGCYWIVAVAALPLPIAAALRCDYWIAGKTLAMITPLLFGLLVMPLARDLQMRVICIAASGALVLANLGFGIARVFAANSAAGIHYRFPPYPTMEGVKRSIRWDIAPALSNSARCLHLDVDIEDPFLDWYVQIALVERGADWVSRRPTNEDLGTGQNFGNPRGRAGAQADCLLTTRRRPNSEQTELVVLPNGTQ